ncbi:MAG: hypothetical protein E7047_10110 [Lentisphaerae bacterium]|nr:hypothetical protein [Lentisphaerota bacterium]
MKNFYCFLLACMLLLPVAGSAADSGKLSVVQTREKFRILHNDKILLDDLHVAVGNDRFGTAPEFDEKILPDGRKVWNVWSRDEKSLFRLELALSQDSRELEISFSASTKAYGRTGARVVRMVMPWSVAKNARYRMLLDNGRSWNPAEGVFTPGEINWNKRSRFTALSLADGSDILLDSNPRGAGDENSMYSRGVVRGFKSVAPKADGVHLVGGSSFDKTGGMIAFKMVIRPGKFEDYDKFHALKSFKYTQSLPCERSFSFGAERTGKNFIHADDQLLSGKNQFGWQSSCNLTLVRSGLPGMYYSGVRGSDNAFVIKNLRNGLHLVTVNIGNWSGAENDFVINCNYGQAVSPPIKAAPREAVSVILPLWVKNNQLEVAFKGKFVVSGLSTQLLTAPAEDFTMERNFWVTDGFEPGVIYRNSDTGKKMSYPVAIDRFEMVEPGKETSGTLRDPAQKTLPVGDWDRKELQWRATMRMKHLSSNAGSLFEYDDEKVFQQFADETRAQKTNGLILSGLHSRHTYPEQETRSLAAIKRMATWAHKNDMRLIDHHDATLVWNDGSGFRVLVERSGETVRNINGLVPSPQFCIMNPEFQAAYTTYLEKLMQTGIDGVMIDELYFYSFGCGCSHCRKAFYLDTNWQLPLNETDERLFNKKSPLWRVWLDWRKYKCAQIRYELRKKLEKSRKDFSMLCYTTHYGFTSEYSSIISGTDIINLGSSVDFFGTEIMPRNQLANQRQLPPLRKMYNSLRIAYNTPIFAWVYSSNWDDFYFGWAVCNMHNQEAALMSLPKTPHGSDYDKFAPPRNMNRLEAQPVAKVALLFSSASRDWNQLMSVHAEMLGMAQTLEELHIPYEFITERSLKPDVLNKYDVLMVGSNACWSESGIAVVKEFARNGGTVQLGAPAGRFDLRGNWREKGGFADVFGWELRRNGDKIKTLWVDGKEYIANYNQGFIRPQVAPIPETMNSGREIVQIGQQMWPLLYEKSYGKGKFYLLPMNFFAQLYAVELDNRMVNRFQRNDKLAALGQRLLKRMIGPAAYWQIDAPEKVLTTIYRQQNKYAVHLLNGTGGGWKLNQAVNNTIASDPYPALLKDITFTLPVGKTVQKVYAVSPDFEGEKSLEFKFDPQSKSVKVTLPATLLKVYTIVWIE